MNLPQNMKYVFDKIITFQFQLWLVNICSNRPKMWPKTCSKCPSQCPNVFSPVCCVTASYLTRNFSLKREQMISNLRIILSHHWSHWRKEGKNQIIFPSFRHFSALLQHFLSGSSGWWWNVVDEVGFFDKGSFQNRHSTLKLKVTIRAFHLKILK